MNRLTSHYKDNGVTVNLKVNSINKIKQLGTLFDFKFNLIDDIKESVNIIGTGNHSGDIYNVQEIKRVLLDALTDKKNESNIND